MDVLGTAISSCHVIYQILSTTAAFPSESKSLAARFKYDARLLQHFCGYFDSKKLENFGNLTPEDELLLLESTAYLASLLQKVEQCRQRLETRARWTREVNRFTWMFRRSDLIELEKELYEWTKRLDLRLIALPEKVRNVIVMEDDPEAQSVVPSLSSRNRLEKYAIKAGAAKRSVWERLVISNKENRLQNWSSFPNVGYVTCTIDGKPAIVEYNPVSFMTVHDQASFDELYRQVGEFAAALNFLDPNVSSIMRCVGIFFENAPVPRFGLVHELPSGTTGAFTSLRDIIGARDENGKRSKLRYTLNQRVELARKLATAVFFVHSVGWVHKAIRPENILIFQKHQRRKAQEQGSSAETDFSRSSQWSIRSACLVGFDAGRDDLAETDAGARNRNSLVDEIYTHPDRQASAEYHTRYTMAHDIYSLGVVLTEVGLWTPLEHRVNLRHGMQGSQIRDTVVNLAKETALMMGEKYALAVQMCLRQGDQEGGSAGQSCIAAVLERLEDLTTAL